MKRLALLDNLPFRSGGGLDRFIVIDELRNLHAYSFPRDPGVASASASLPQHSGRPFRHRSSNLAIVHSNTGLWILRFTMLCCSHSHMEKLVRESTLPRNDKYDPSEPDNQE